MKAKQDEASSLLSGVSSGHKAADRVLGCLSASASFVGDGSAAGGTGNTPLANFGGMADLPYQDAVNAVSSRLPKSLRMPARVRSGDEFEKLHLGFDTLEWSAAITDDELAGVVPELEYLAVSGEPLDVEGLEVVVRRVGGISHAFLISTAVGLSVWVPRKPMYRLRVVASPKYILSQDVEDLEERAAILVSSLCRLDEIPVLMLSRVDVALDVIMPVKRFETMLERIATRDSSVVRRAHLLAPRIEGNRYRSVQVGKSDIVLRIYDKMAEALKTGDWDLWLGVYGPLVLPPDTTVVRIEYQQRTGFLKQNKDVEMIDSDSEMPLFPDGLRTLAQYRAAAPATLLYLTQSWFRFAGKKKGADNARCTLGWWQVISNLFVSSEWYTFVASTWRSCARVASKNLDRLVAMSAGCLSAVAAILSYRGGGDKVGVKDVLRYMFDYLMEYDFDGFDRYDKWIDGRDKRYQSLRFGVRL